MSYRRTLPIPATQVDEYLHDVAVSLRQLNDQLAQMSGMLAQMTVEIASTPAMDDIALREPAPSASAKKRRHRDELREDGG
jgi:hypothetical protein